MPITQERMISICTEGLAQRQTLISFRDEILSTLRQYRADPLMAITIIEGITAVLQLPSADNLIRESMHWRYRKRDNEKNRERMRRRRGTPSGIQPNAPHSLIRPLAAADFEGLDLQAEYEKWNKGEL